MKIEEIYQLYKKHSSVQTDSRKIENGNLFFALKGPNFNGNQFATQAIKTGAAFAFVDEPEYADNNKIIAVDDVLKTLQLLALHHRQQFSVPFIAITGSNGKTTTKELIHTVLSTSYKTYTTQGNLNNHIGIPLTILSIKDDAQMAVIEMGANHVKEIEAYCKYTLPTHGLITNIGKAHLEGFGSIEGVKKAKGELYEFLKLKGGIAFIMWDYSYLREMSKGIREIVKYGSEDCDIVGELIQSDPFLSIRIKRGMKNIEINTRLVGAYNLPNVLAAVAVGKYFKVPDEKIINAIESYLPSNSRSQLLEWNGNKVILDAYNANPTSMKLAIENFAGMNPGEKILLLGGMAELGKESLHEHEMIIDLINKYNWKEVILVGGDFMKIDHGYKKFDEASEAGRWLQKQQFKNVYLLVKGSRSMRMEKVLE